MARGICRVLASKPCTVIPGPILNHEDTKSTKKGSTMRGGGVVGWIHVYCDESGEEFNIGTWFWCALVVPHIPLIFPLSVSQCPLKAAYRGYHQLLVMRQEKRNQSYIRNGANLTVDSVGVRKGVREPSDAREMTEP